MPRGIYKRKKSRKGPKFAGGDAVTMDAKPNQRTRVALGIPERVNLEFGKKTIVCDVSGDLRLTPRMMIVKL